MANIQLTAFYADLDDWPGNLLRADTDSTITLATATSFHVTLGPSSDFEDYRVEITGTGFLYLDGVPIAGTITGVEILNADGDTLATITDLAGEIPTDLSQLWASMSGSPDGNGPGPDGREAWDLLTLGNDVITGTEGDDRRSLVNYNQGNDTYNMLGGDDSIRGDVGTDTYNGGSGFDRLTFFDSHYQVGSNVVGGIKVKVAAGTVRDVWGFTDRFTSIEEFEGSRFRDIFKGSATTDDRFTGLRGNDVFKGGGATVLADGRFGGDDNDRLFYESDFYNGGKFGIVVDLETSFANGRVTGTIRDGFGNTDTVVDIERVFGTRYGDAFVGSRADNQFGGGEGTDSYDGAGGSDRVWFDWWAGDSEPTGIHVDLTLATGQVVDDGFGNTESMTGIEEIGGTNGDDLIIMDDNDNKIQSNRGQDTMTGGGGEDTFFFVDDDEGDSGDVVTDFVSGEDMIVFDSRNWDGMTTSIRLENGTSASTGNATAFFDAATHTLYWDADGTGAQDAIAVVTLDGVVSLTTGDVLAY